MSNIEFIKFKTINLFLLHFYFVFLWFLIEKKSFFFDCCFCSHSLYENKLSFFMLCREVKEESKKVKK